MSFIRGVRGCLSGFCFFIFGAGALIIGVVILPLVFLSVRDRLRARAISIRVIKRSWHLFIFIMRFVGLIGVKVQSNISIPLSDIKGCVIVSNHPSLIDIVILSTLFADPMCIVKGKLKENWFMKHIVRRIYITNDLAAENLLQDCREALKLGYNLVIFPEGTRSLPNKAPCCHRSPAHIAVAAHSSIIALNISLTDAVLGKHQRFYEVSDRRIIYTITVRSYFPALQDESIPNSLNVRNIMRRIKKDIE
ncbi:MAG: 1-acyl-sn-glycerol-3-phosphate acyltransferase [Deferribacteraceae bacterium]|jgi:1-acyl-sn-glycerol-3-phosphate acyltransferase|nr:1-acyl-sn-glycerol-3-phosphate acyltransferase [Deferribacteraceae bacterium]